MRPVVFPRALITLLLAIVNTVPHGRDSDAFLLCIEGLINTDCDCQRKASLCEVTRMWRVRTSGREWCSPVRG